MAKKSQTITPREGDKVICLSYVPLLYSSNAGEFYNTQDMMNVIADRVQQAVEISHAKACLWVVDNGEIIPVFVLERGDEIVDHLLVWTENKVGKWFTIDLADRPGCYVMCLHPNLQLSASRQAAAYRFKSGRKIPKTSVNFIYVPLVFQSATRGTLDAVLPKLGSSCKLGIIDEKKFDPNASAEDSSKHTRIIGPFQFRRNPEDTKQLLAQFLDSMKSN